MTVHSEKDPEIPEVQEKSENETKTQNSVLQKFKRYSKRNKALIVISLVLHSIFILAIGTGIGYNLGNLEEKHSLHAYDILENDEHFELLSTIKNQTNQDLTAIKVRPGGRFNLTDFDDNLALVIAETQDTVKSSDIFYSIKEQGILKSFIHPSKTSSTWTIKVEDDYNGVYYSVNFLMDKVHVDNEGHIVFCSQPKVFSIECSYNTDFNDLFGDATERIFTFYSWGMIEKWTVPKANLTTKLIYMRLSEENNYILE